MTCSLGLATERAGEGQASEGIDAYDANTKAHGYFLLGRNFMVSTVFPLKR
jgi:hypothetical protein